MSEATAREVGFWYNDYEDKHRPMPVANPEPWNGQAEFIAKLMSIEVPLMSAYQAQIDRYNTALIARSEDRSLPYPEMPKDTTVVAYRGYSPCRICDQSNGSREYHYGGWIWPQGYIHYLRDHNVLPDEDFKRFVMEHQIEENRRG
jgi:hypothetical protein